MNIHSIEWDKPTYIPDCKYVFFQGLLGDGQPATSTTFSAYKFVPVSDIPATSTFRLQRVATLLRREAADEERRRADASRLEAIEQRFLHGTKE